MFRHLYAKGGISSLSQARHLLERHAPKGEHLAYINKEEADLLKRRGGAGIPVNESGIPSYFSLNPVKWVKEGVDFLGSAADKLVPNELAKPLMYAAPFLGPVYGPIAYAAGSANRSGGKIDLLGTALMAAPYVQFGGNPAATGLESLLPTGYGGSQYGIFGGDQIGIGSGKSLSSILSNKVDEIFKSPTKTDMLYSDPEFMNIGTDRSAGQLYDEAKLTTAAPGDITQVSGAERAQDVAKSIDQTKAVIKEPGYTDILKKAVSGDVGEKFEAIKDLSGKALRDLYTTPVRNAAGEIVDYNLDKKALISTLVAGYTYVDALQKAKEAGLDDKEFNEDVYQQEKLSPYKSTYSQRLPASSFGITAAKKDGGRIGFKDGIGPMSNNRVSQLIQLLRDAEAKGDTDTAEQIRSDLYRETKKANGGRIGYESGDLVLEEGPVNKETRLQMERAAKRAEAEYIKRKAEEKLLDENYKKLSMYDWKKSQKELFDMAPEEGYDPLPEPIKPQLTPKERGVMSIKLAPSKYDVRGNKKANGGRITKRQNYFLGNLVKASGVAEPVEKKIGLFTNSDGSYPSGNGFGGLIKQLINQNPQMFAKRQVTDRPVNDLYQYYLNNENDSDVKNQILEANRSRFNRANGGVMDVAPMRMLKGGIPEMDLRAKGGYVPYGKKERADDVPAMLSKNEFVFTAKAVRNAGNGSINKGAQKMYKLMKSLEKKKVN